MSENQMKPDFRKTYAIRFTIGMVAYVVLLLAAILIAPNVAEGPARIFLGVAPIPGVIFIALAALKYSRDADEFARRQLTESLAIGFFFGSALVVSYGLLEAFGAPQLSWLLAFAAYMMCWAIGSFIVGLKYRS